MAAQNCKSSVCGCERRDSRPTQWEQLFRKFSESNKEVCHTVTVDIPTISRGMKNLPSGSTYIGTWDVLGMSGKGTYTFPNGVVYEGEFHDGMFHGSGQLRYPSGAILEGRWNEGEIYERTLFFADGLQYSEHNWRYCKMPDRRFTIEYNKGLKPAGQSYLTADQPSRTIPPGHYDTGDGFYDPKTKAIYYANDMSSIVRSPQTREQKWIIENCRTSPESIVGPSRSLYEEWSVANINRRVDKTPAVPCRDATNISPPYLSSERSDREIEIKFKDLEDESEYPSNDGSD